MFRIGVFSKLVHVSARMLRHYEKCGLIYPADFDKLNGNRYYSASQIPLVNRITTLRDMGFSIDEIGDMLENFEDKAYMEQVITAKNSEVQLNIEIEKAKLERLAAMTTLVEAKNYCEPHPITVKPLPGLKVLAIRETLPDYGYQEELWRKLFAFISENRLHGNLEGRVLCIYHNLEFAEKNVDIEVAVTVNELSVSQGAFTYKETEEIPMAAVGVFSGHYKNMVLWEGIMAQWIEANRYEVIGCERGLGLKHAFNEDNPDLYQTEIQFPIRKITKGEN